MTTISTKLISTWVVAAGVLIGAVMLIKNDLFGPVGAAGSAVLVALPITVIGVALWGLLIVLIDRSHAQVRAAWALAFTWGAIAACGTAGWFNDLAGGAIRDVLDDPNAGRWDAALSGPINEEILKGVGIALVLVIFRDSVRRPLQAFSVGAFAGLGFQLIENISYAALSALSDNQSDVSGAVHNAFGRSLVGFGHWMYSGFIGVGLILLFSRRIIGVLPLVVGLLLHVFWNSPPPTTTLVMLVALVVKYTGPFVAIGALWFWMLRDQRRWLTRAIATPEAETLGSPQELATLPTRKLRRAAQAAARASGGPEAATATRKRQDELIRELTTAVG